MSKLNIAEFTIGSAVYGCSFLVLLMSSNSQITFYGGVHEIGGNKFLLEDKGTKVFLDFGMQMGKVNQYFTEFLQPRTCNL
jgi:predicted metal-dependent RNase